MEEIISELAKKYRISKVSMNAICSSPFKMMSTNIRNGNLKNFNLPGFGKILVKLRYKENIQEYIKNSREKKDGKLKNNPGRVEK